MNPSQEKPNFHQIGADRIVAGSGNAVALPLMGNPTTREAGSIEQARPMTLLHVVEALKGGPASYMREILSAQEEELGRQNIGLIIPRDQCAELPAHLHLSTNFFASHQRRLLNILNLGIAVRRRLAEHPADVVHAQGTFAGVAVRLAVRFMTQPPKVVYCSHGWAFDRLASPWKNLVAVAVERLLARWADSIVCISDHDYRSALGSGIDPLRLVKIVNGISDASFPATVLPIAWSEGRRRFLFVGRFDRQKGLDLFLDAMDAIGDEAVGFAVGSHAVNQPLSIAFPANVQSTGWLPRETVQQYIASADVVVMPSRWEGFGLTALEAMRAGKPVVAADVGGLSEIVVHGTTGLLVAPDNVNALIAAMTSLSSELIGSMGMAGRARFLEFFQADRMNRSLINLYRLHSLS